MTGVRFYDFIVREVMFVSVIGDNIPQSKIVALSEALDAPPAKLTGEVEEGKIAMQAPAIEPTTRGMKSSNTSERLQSIMAARGLRQVDILERCRPFCDRYAVKLGRNDLSQYISGKYLPGQRKLTVLALALDVSEAWLMGYDVPMSRGEEKTPPPTLEVSEDERVLIELFRAISEDQKKLCLAMIRTALGK